MEFPWRRLSRAAARAAPRRRRRGCRPATGRHAVAPPRRRSSVPARCSCARWRARQRVEAFGEARQGVVGNRRPLVEQAQGDTSPSTSASRRRMPPGGVKSRALSSRLASAWRSRNCSPRTSQGPSRRFSTRNRWRWIRAAWPSSRDAAISRRSTLPTSSRPCRCSTWARLSRRSISCCRRSPRRRCCRRSAPAARPASRRRATRRRHGSPPMGSSVRGSGYARSAST